MIQFFGIKSAFYGLLFVTALGCSQGESDSEIKLINGKVASKTQFGSTLVYLLPNGGQCTGTKVSERHILTAAHCLADSFGRLRSGLVTGSRLRASNFPERTTSDTSKWFDGKVKNYWVFDQFTRECASSGGVCGRGTQLAFLPPPDLALIEVEGSLPAQWPSAKIDRTYVWSGDSVVNVGYGCENGTNSATTSNNVRKKYGRTAVIPGSTINDLNPRVSDANMNAFESYYFMTPGSHYNYVSSADNVSLCPGDSGGPVYRDSKDEVVVGIHSSYIFYTADDYSWANRHTRLVDPWAETDVLGWLDSFLTDASFTTTPISNN